MSSLDDQADLEARNASNPRKTSRMAPDMARLDRLPPHDVEAEQGCLGCVLLDPETNADLLLEQL
jgi:hypothetical protein